MISEDSKDYINVVDERKDSVINNEDGRIVLEDLDSAVLQNHVSHVERSNKYSISGMTQFSQSDSVVTGSVPYPNNNAAEGEHSEHRLHHLLHLGGLFIKRFKKSETEADAVEPAIEAVAILLGGSFILLVFSLIIILLL